MIGEKLGPYALQSELGSGGMGRVYKAVDGNGRRCALKVLHPHLLESEALHRFRREADLGRRVEHANVVRTYAAGAEEFDGAMYHYLVMEYVEGQTLRALLRELGKVPEDLCRHVGREITRALEAIHAVGAVHRDLKPENVLITKDHVVKVMDLGVAWLMDTVMKLSRTGDFVGSLLYAAPEQFEGRTPDGRADYYALGLVLYELAAGKHPFRGAGDLAEIVRRQLHEAPRPIAELNPQLSPFYEEVVAGLLERDRDKRLAFLPDGEDSPWWRERAQAIRRRTKRPLRRIRIPRETAVYGREDEFARLHTLYETAKRGDGRVVLIDGEAGIGKSRLVDELTVRLRRGGEDFHFLFGCYPPSGAATAAGAFSAAYREQLGEDGSLPYLQRTPLLAPAFDAVLNGDAPPAGKEPLTKDSLQTCFVQTTRALAADRPTVVLIEDLHFAPKEGRALFAALAMALPGHRVLLIGTTRPGATDEWQSGLNRLDHTERLTLGRLGPKDLVRLLEDAFESRALASRLAAQIALKSDGNPFFTFEIIRDLREGEFITKTDEGEWISTKAVERIEIPSSVLDLIRGRIADLDEVDKSLLEVAACGGFEFDPLLVGDVLRMDRIPMLQRLGRIEKAHRLVRSVGMRYVFDHHQVQEALYADIAEPLRREYHAALAESLEARGEDRGGGGAVELCQHFLNGGRGERAVRHLDAALTHLEDGHLNEQALALTTQALDTVGLYADEARMKLLLRQASFLDLAGRRDEQRRANDEALALARAEGTPALLAPVELALGVQLFRMAQYDDAHGLIVSAIEHAREAGLAMLQSRAEGNLGGICYARGEWPEARACHERALELAGDSAAERGVALGNLGNLSWAEGDHDQAREHYTRCLELARKSGNRGLEAAATGNLGVAFAAQGRYEDSRVYQERRLELAREAGNRRAEAIALYNLGGPLMRLARLGAAAENFELSVALAREVGDPRLAAGNFWMLGEVAESSGDAAAAERYYADAARRMRELGDRVVLLAPVLASLGGFLRDQGRVDEARAHLTEAQEIAQAAGPPGTLVMAANELALLPGGDPAEAERTFREHEDRLGLPEQMDAHFSLWKAGRGPHHLAEARRLMDEALALVPEEYHAAMRTKLRMYRAIDEASDARD